MSIPNYDPSDAFRRWGDFFLKDVAYRFTPPALVLKYIPEKDIWSSIQSDNYLPKSMSKPVCFTIDDKAYMGVAARQLADSPEDNSFYQFDPDRGHVGSEGRFPRSDPSQHQEQCRRFCIQWI